MRIIIIKVLQKNNRNNRDIIANDLDISRIIHRNKIIKNNRTPDLLRYGRMAAHHTGGKDRGTACRRSLSGTLVPSKRLGT